MRAVIDTNVFVYGVMGSTDLSLKLACQKILRAVQENRVIPVVNGWMLEEYIRVTSVRAFSQHSKFARYMNLFAEKAVVFKHTNKSICDWDPRWIYDPDDKIFVECAIDGNVPFVISHDYSLKRFIDWNLSQGHNEAVATVEECGIRFLSPEGFADHVLD